MALSFTKDNGTFVSNSVDRTIAYYDEAFAQAWPDIERTIPEGAQITLTCTRSSLAPTIILYTKRDGGLKDTFGYVHSQTEPMELAKALTAGGYAVQIKID